MRGLRRRSNHTLRNGQNAAPTAAERALATPDDLAKLGGRALVIWDGAQTGKPIYKPFMGYSTHFRHETQTARIAKYIHEERWRVYEISQARGIWEIGSYILPTPYYPGAHQEISSPPLEVRVDRLFPGEPGRIETRPVEKDQWLGEVLGSVTIDPLSRAGCTEITRNFEAIIANGTEEATRLYRTLAS